MERKGQGARKKETNRLERGNRVSRVLGTTSRRATPRRWQKGFVKKFIDSSCPFISSQFLWIQSFDPLLKHVHDKQEREKEREKKGRTIRKKQGNTIMDVPGQILSALPRSIFREGPAGISTLLLLVLLYEKRNWTGKYEKLGRGSPCQVEELCPLFFSASPVTGGCRKNDSPSRIAHPILFLKYSKYRVPALIYREHFPGTPAGFLCSASVLSAPGNRLRRVSTLKTLRRILDY